MTPGHANERGETLAARRSAGTPATLRATSWSGKAPEPGDLVCTDAGSWYLVDRVTPTGVGYRLGVVRLGRRRPPEADDGRPVIAWRWDPRRRR